MKTINMQSLARGANYYKNWICARRKGVPGQEDFEMQEVVVQDMDKEMPILFSGEEIQLCWGNRPMGKKQGTRWMYNGYDCYGNLVFCSIEPW